MYKKKEEVAEILETYFSICTAIVTEDSSNHQKHKINYLLARQQLLELENQLFIPNWILTATTPSVLKSHVDLKVEGGPGSWSRRRAFLNSAMNTIQESYHNAVTKAVAGDLKNVEQTDLITNREKSKGYVFNPLSQPTSATLRQDEVNRGLSNIGSSSVQRKKVFIVHGHDELLKSQVHIFLSQEGYEPIILHEQLNKGATIIEKLENNIDTVSFAVILYTACDEGKSVKESLLKPRSRQNVVFEHGYLICKLGRDKVATLKSDGVEIPGDISGLITIPATDWKYELLKEIKAAIG